MFFSVRLFLFQQTTMWKNPNFIVMITTISVDWNGGGDSEGNSMSFRPWSGF